jgi:hypothetical protein
MAETQGGQIWVEIEVEDKGSHFDFTIPLTQKG